MYGSSSRDKIAIGESAAALTHTSRAQSRGKAYVYAIALEPLAHVSDRRDRAE